VFFWSDQERPKELHGLKFLVLARSGGKYIFTNHDTAEVTSLFVTQCHDGIHAGSTPCGNVASQQ
jgi:hypothetical protein